MKLQTLLPLGLVLGSLTALGAQSNSAMPAQWPTHHGDWTGRHYSTLAQINATNIKSLSLAWVYRSRTDEPPSGAIKSTPVVVDDVLYTTLPDYVWAVDARTGREIWRYVWKQSSKTQSRFNRIGNRGVAVAGDWLYFVTGDNFLVSLNRKNGTERWRIEFADSEKEFFSTVSPVVIGKYVIFGPSNGSFRKGNSAGFLEARDIESGALAWRWYVTPRRGEPGSETWSDPDVMEAGGGYTWLSGTYDPDLNLYYTGTGEPLPNMIGLNRKGDNLWTSALVALNPTTGKLVWYFQPVPHDTHDWDNVQVPVLIDGQFGGRARKMVAQITRSGYYFLLDRTTGEALVSTKWNPEANWATGINAKGQPIWDPKRMETDPAGTLISPHHDATNWWAPSFNPQTGILYVNGARAFNYSYSYVAEDGEHRIRRVPEFEVPREFYMTAIDYRTGKIKWTKELDEMRGPAAEAGGIQGEIRRSNGGFGQMSGVLSTAGNLLFTGDVNSNFLALDPATGKTLWHANLGGIFNNPPITYESDGRQYVVVGAGDTLFAFTVR